MTEPRITQIRDLDTGLMLRFDEANHTVTLPDGRVLDFVEHDPSAMLQRDFSLSDVHVAAALTNFAVDYGSQQGQAIADLVAPPILVDKASDYYHTFDKNNRYRRVNTLLSTNDGAIPEIGAAKSSSSYTVDSYGASTFVPLKIEAGADAVVQPRMRAMRRIMNAMVTDREHRVAAAALNATTFASYLTTLTSSNFWDDGADSDPRKNIIDATEAMLAPCTHMALSEKSWNRLVHNAKSQQYGISVGMAVNEAPAAFMARLGFPNITPLIGRMRSESTTTGTTTLSFVWDDDVLFFHNPQGSTEDEQEVPTIRTFRWVLPGMSAASGGFRIREWDQPDRGSDGGRKMAVLCDEKVVVTGVDTGYMIQNVW